jgi:hypothetical protein
MELSRRDWVQPGHAQGMVSGVIEQISFLSALCRYLERYNLHLGLISAGWANAIRHKVVSAMATMGEYQVQFSGRHEWTDPNWDAEYLAFLRRVLWVGFNSKNFRQFLEHILPAEKAHRTRMPIAHGFGACPL